MSCERIVEKVEDLQVGTDVQADDFNHPKLHLRTAEEQIQFAKRKSSTDQHI
jgi:hypothetical protein